MTDLCKQLISRHNFLYFYFDFYFPDSPEIEIQFPSAHGPDE